MIYTIKNSLLTAKINTLGAELVSVKSNATDVEFIWQGDEKYWSSHSPILFPFCGRLHEQKYLYKNEEFSIKKHGFAKFSEFIAINIKDSEISFKLSNNEETLSLFPFEFDFVVKYKLKENNLQVQFQVNNKSKSKMYFSLGGHPAFNCPLNSHLNFDDYYLEFSNKEYIQRIFSENALSIEQTTNFEKIKNGVLPLEHSLFDNDAIFLDLYQGKDKIILKSDLSKERIEMTFNEMTCVGLWHKNLSDAPYVCIEPWHGFPGREGIIEDIEKMKETIVLDSGSAYSNSFEIKFVS